jgi:predicted dienelactone hydrolase
MNDLIAALGLAPGGYPAFGDDGLAEVTMPVMLMGGTLDEYTRNDLRPTFDALPRPRMRVEIEQMGHMGFTDICRLPINQLIPTLGDLCAPDAFIPVDRGFEIINAFATAFLRLEMFEDRRMLRWLSDEYADGIPEATFSR